MTASMNPNNVDINDKSKEKEEALYLKSMDSLMDELSKKYTDLSKNKGLSDEEILNYGFSIEDISKGRSNGGSGLTADVSNQTLDRFANESRYIRVDLLSGKFHITREGIIACRRIQSL
ncbi:MAG: hypothetical protein ACJ72U_16340 [Nitrososphaeraceae archaeon]|jgi:hypothetical protein